MRGEAPSLVIYSLPSWDSANNGGVWKISVGGPATIPMVCLCLLTAIIHNGGSWTLSASHFETSPHANDFFQRHHRSQSKVRLQEKAIVHLWVPSFLGEGWWRWFCLVVEPFGKQWRVARFVFHGTFSDVTDTKPAWSARRSHRRSDPGGKPPFQPSNFFTWAMKKTPGCFLSGIC